MPAGGCRPARPRPAPRRRGRPLRRPASSSAPGRRAPGRSACRPRHPCRPSCRARRSAFDVEDVVDDLEGEADLGGPARRPRLMASSAPAMTAPATAEARISAPVLRACMSARPAASSDGGALRRPPGRAEIDRLAADHAGRAGGVGDQREHPQLAVDAAPRSAGSRASSANASACRPSPARIAMPSPATTCSVGRPRRSVSSSIAGRSSWMSE